MRDGYIEVSLTYGDMTVGKAKVWKDGEILAKIDPRHNNISWTMYEWFMNQMASGLSIGPNITPAPKNADMERAEYFRKFERRITPRSRFLTPEDIRRDYEKALERWNTMADENIPPQPVVGGIDRAQELVFDYIKDRLEKTDTHVDFHLSDVYVVWFCKTLQNWKALVSTTLPDGMYYEVTYNGAKKETYIDAYKKWDNVCIKDPNKLDPVQGPIHMIPEQSPVAPPYKKWPIV